ncbi:MAG: primosomal protein N', partial [Deltaproteobacteria bacterium]|nr:primosomal protein N' [Deltaproteobacteria bacterium]
SRQFAPFLLHGVTGSGKTEIYIKLINKVLIRGEGAIYLVPEIALTIELVDRLVHEFGDQVAVLHSGLSAGERYDQWRQIASGKARIAVGARSAIFAPLKAIGVIIVDEEHEPSYKQESNFAYNGRDLALLRGQMADCCVVLGSATPSLISYHGAQNGRYQLLSLPERLDQKAMPKVEIVDLAKTQKNMFAWDGFSARLLERMQAVFAENRQVMLFLNKRGFSRTLYCLNCGHMPECQLCSVHMTFHKNLELLVCHYCGGQQSPPETCPKCGGQRFFPLGIGIQKLEEGLAKHFPEITVLRLDRDATRRKGELGRIIEEFRAGKAQVLLGTQMLAKGHNFPGVDLVGVIFADLSLEMPEFTAPERTFQLLAQVAGRAGRGRKSATGEVIVQTLQPDHFSVLTATAHDYHSFYKQELQNRRELGFPPFSYLANLRVTGTDQERVREFLNHAKALGQKISGMPTPAELLDSLDSDPDSLDEPDFRPPPIALLGPVPATIVKIQNRYRWSLLLKARERHKLHSFLRQWRGLLPTPNHLQWRIDIDPQSFF